MIWIILIILLSLILRTVNLGLIPKGINLPEAEHIFILRNFIYPIFFTNLSLSNKLLIIRLIIALPASFTPLLIYQLAKKINLNEQQSLLWAFFTAITPWHIYLSRRFLTAPFILIIFLLILLSTGNKKNIKFLFPALFVSFSLISIIVQVYFLPIGQVVLKPVDNFFSWLSNIAEYFNLSRLCFEDEIFILGLKENSPLLAFSVILIITGFFKILKNFKNYFFIFAPCLICIAIYSFFYPAFNLSLAYFLIIPYSLLTALGAESLINLNLNKKLKLTILSLFFLAFFYNFSRAVFLFNYHQPSFDQFQKNSAYPILLDYLSNISLKNKILVEKNLVSEKSLLFSNWLLLGKNKTHPEELFIYSICNLQTTLNNNSNICILNSSNLPEGFNLIKVIKNLRNEEVFWIIERVSPLDIIQ